jgi:pimeloyl-ACP methyl ester carboxylesterase
LANGINLYYEFEGEGAPLVQLHGSGFGRGNFATLTPLLRRRFRVLDFDMRGFGDSDAPIGQYSMEQWADDVAGLLDALELPSAHIHGTSMGGMVAIAFAAKYPARTDGLVLTCSLAKYDRAALINKRVWKAIVDAYGKSDEFVDLMAFQVFSRAYLDSDRAAAGIALIRQLIGSQTDPAISAAINSAIESADLTPLLPRIAAPTLVVGGRFDIVTPIEMGPSGAGARILAERIPNATLTIIDAAHLFLVERPEETADMISGFLAGIRAPIASSA